VQPQNAQVQQGKFLRQRLVGATLSIPAQPGLTTDWLKWQGDEHQARMGGRLSAILRSQPSFGRPNFAALAET